MSIVRSRKPAARVNAHRFCSSTSKGDASCATGRDAMRPARPVAIKKPVMKTKGAPVQSIIDASVARYKLLTARHATAQRKMSAAPTLVAFIVCRYAGR